MSRIALVGDSLTEGYYDDGQSYHPYSTIWHKKSLQIINYGVSGALLTNIKGQHWLGQVLLQIQSDRKYDVIVFMAGTNDLAWKVPTETLWRNWKFYAEVLYDYCSNLVVCTVPNAQHPNPQRDVLNQKIRAWVAEQGCVPLADVAKHIPYSSATYDDGLHFNPKGYDELGQLIYQYI